MKILNKKNIKKILRGKFVKYVLIASATTLVNVIVYLLCYSVIIKNIIVSNIFAYVFSITLSFILNERIVYKCQTRKYKKQIPLFLASKALSFAIDSLVLVCLDKYFNISALLEKLIANASTTISNYFICDKIVFKNDKK
ncbi:MAG: GtrA family protein [Bacilli bacterium]|nr:GtrA family protein [bacterium]MDY2697443.1 GtrA family protein [Bacilli bacterium]